MIARSSIRLIVSDLAVARGMRIIFSGLNFEVASGGALTLVGPNGAGKTTLLRALGGFLRAVSGDIRIEGGMKDAGVSEQCHYIGHANGVKPALTVTENLEFFANYLGDGRAAPDEAANRLALDELMDVPAGLLSAGQQRRLGLARLLCAQRPLWLLDEPAVSLDTASQALLGDAVKGHLAAGGMVIAATHMPLGWSEAATLELGMAEAA